ncbi:MAG TPA: ABC transporter permease [Blastocatellia bacterium]|nr:ABC transporter permease [Blastocatellia bacterium]
MSNTRLTQLAQKAHTAEVGEAFRLALGAINQYRFQSSLTLLGMIMGVATVIVVVALVQGLDNTVKDALSRLNPNTFVVGRMGFSDFGNPDFQELLKRRPPLTMDDAQALRTECPTIKLVSPFYAKMAFDPIHVWYKGEEAQSPLLRGVDQYFGDVTGIVVDRGRSFTAQDSNGRREVCILGRAIADGLFGAEDPLGKMIHIDSAVYEVIGLLEEREVLFGGPSENQIVLIPFGTFDKHYSEKEKEFLQFFCLVNTPEDVERGMDEAREVLRHHRRIKSDAPDTFVVFASNQIVDIWTQASSGVSILMVGIASLGLFIGGIGVMNIMLVSVTERTAEIGLRKAVGARRRDVLWQFLLEAMMLTIMGGAVGVLVGIAMAVFIQFVVPSLKASISGAAIVSGLIVSMGVGVFFGLWPAYRAAKLNPIEALRYER